MFLIAVQFLMYSFSSEYIVWCFGMVLAALGFCTFDVSSIKLILEWFPNNVGLAGAINSIGFSFNLIWAFFGYLIINPNNMPATLEIQEGYRKTRLFDESIAMNVP